MEQRWRDHLRNNCCRVIPGLVFGRRSRTSDHDRAWGISHRGPSFLPDVGIYNTTNGAFSVSGLGVIAYSFGSTGGRQLSWLDRTGKVIEKVGPFMALRTLRYRPIRSGLPFNSSLMTCGSWS